MQRHYDSSEEHQVPIITKENVIVVTKIPAKVDGFLNISGACMESLMKESWRSQHQQNVISTNL